MKIPLRLITMKIIVIIIVIIVLIEPRPDHWSVSRPLTLLHVPQVCLEVRVAGCGPTVAQCRSPDWGGRRRAAVTPTSARTACWLKTLEAGSLRAAPLKLNTHSSVRRRLTLTERHSEYLQLQVITTSVNMFRSYLMIRNHAALYISFHIFVIIKIAAQTDKRVYEFRLSSEMLQIFIYQHPDWNITNWHRSGSRWLKSPRTSLTSICWASGRSSVCTERHVLFHCVVGS